MNNSFTIVIPYHAQTQTIDFVKRQLNYYHLDPLEMEVILAVSGEEIIKSELERFINELNDPRFLMLNINETDIKNVDSFLSKIHQALKITKTPYVIINGADDVIIPSAAYDGCEVLSKNRDIAAIKGYTICFNCETGEILTVRDSEILSDSPVKRLKEAMKDRDSIFYIIRRTSDLVREYENIINLSRKSNVVGNSLYHLEHFKALGVAALGKVCVFKYPWRVYTVHSNNSTSHTESSFIRIKIGIIDKSDYEWFRSLNKNMECLSYNKYRFLWICHQIRGISVTWKQIAYHFLYKNAGFLTTLRISTYYLLHKIFILTKKLMPSEAKFLDNDRYFFSNKHYIDLKKQYFSDQDIKLIESYSRGN